MRSTLALAALSATLLPSTWAFKDTSPLLLWASDPTNAFQEAARLLSSSALTPAEEVYAKLSTLGCDWETVVVAHLDDLHNTHLPSIRYPTHDAHLHIPYLSKPDRQALTSRIGDWASRCGADVVGALDEGVGKRVVQLDVKGHEAIPSLPSDLPFPHMLILTGSRSSPSKQKRQDDEYPFPTYTSISATTTATATPTAVPTTTSRNSTIPTDGPLLERVQILTAPIITALLVSFGLFIPIAAFGVYALTGIQVPPRMMEIGKGLVVDKGRKDQ